MISDKEAHAALQQILNELPYHLGKEPGTVETMEEFRVIKKSNVRRVHEGLWKLRVYFDEKTTQDYSGTDGVHLQP